MKVENILIDNKDYAVYKVINVDETYATIKNLKTGKLVRRSLEIFKLCDFNIIESFEPKKNQRGLRSLICDNKERLNEIN